MRRIVRYGFAHSPSKFHMPDLFREHVYADDHRLTTCLFRSRAEALAFFR
jgi:hypothetical protein